MKKGGSKSLSVDHEIYIARLLHGRRSPSSGSADTDEGDVRAGDYLVECKLTGRPGAPARSTLLKQFTKATEEAYSIGTTPVLALRFFDPENPFAKTSGWVDLLVMRDADVLDLMEQARSRWA